jgi:hypothetical protein
MNQKYRTSTLAVFGSALLCFVAAFLSVALVVIHSSFIWPAMAGLGFGMTLMQVAMNMADNDDP